jgi:hypothetical protein
MRLILVGLLLLGRADSVQAAGLESGHLDVPQGRLWYEARGAGPALVLLHDGLIPSEAWDAQVGPFSRHDRVVRYDRRRYGRSASETDDFSNVADLKALLDHLKIETRGGVLVRDLSHASPRGGRVSGYFVASEEARGRPGLLFLHHGQGDRLAAVALRALLPPEKRPAYLEALAPLDGVRYLERRPKAPLLVQLARGDEHISRLDGALFAAAAGEPVTTTWHDGEHFDLGRGSAREERRVFLLRSLAPAAR